MQQCLKSIRGKASEKRFGPKLGSSGPKSGPKLGFSYFLQLGLLVFLEIALDDSLQQCLTSSRGKASEKFFGPKSGSKLGFSYFLHLGLLIVLLEIA